MRARPTRWLVSYDVCQPRRLARVHRFLVRHALPVQYSVFVAELDRAELRALLAGLARLIDHRADDVRAYPLSGVMRGENLGRPELPRGIGLAAVAGLPEDVMQDRDRATEPIRRQRRCTT